MFVGRLLISIIIVTYRLAFEPGRPMDLRQQVQDSYRDRSVESRGSRFKTASSVEESSETVLGKFLARTLDL